jgi:hypothetical protein
MLNMHTTMKAYRYTYKLCLKDVRHATHVIVSSCLEIVSRNTRVESCARSKVTHEMVLIFEPFLAGF